MREELYNIKADIGEAHDLANVASHATTVREMRVMPMLVAHILSNAGFEWMCAAVPREMFMSRLVYAGRTECVVGGNSCEDAAARPGV